jgi:hypothetical protein
MFCDIDDFCQRLQAVPPLLVPSREGQKKSSRCLSLTLREIMTILVFFHASHYRTFKHCYQGPMLGRGRADFPGLASESRSVEPIPMRLLPLCA